MDFDRKQPKQPDSSCVIALMKGDGERYIYVFDEATTSQTLRAIAQNAADKELSLTWHDAAVLSNQVRAIENLLDEDS
jgi:hypothetical protein